MIDTEYIRFSVGILEPSGCVGGYLQIHDSEYDTVNKVNLEGEKTW